MKSALAALLATLIGSTALLAVSHSAATSFAAFLLLLGSLAGLLVAMDRRVKKL